jgi:serine O-acetyltransferase
MQRLWWLLFNFRSGGCVVRLLYDVLQTINGSSISIYSHFATFPCLPHGLKGIFVSGAARIGRDCVIFHQVTIGSNSLIDSKSRGSPVIGDKCYIGAGAKIIGNVRIGNNVRIGANAVVCEDVPDNCVVYSGAMIIRQKEATMDNRFYNAPGKWMCFEGGKFVEVVDERLELLKSSARASGAAYKSQ